MNSEKLCFQIQINLKPTKRPKGLIELRINGIHWKRKTFLQNFMKALKKPSFFLPLLWALFYDEPFFSLPLSPFILSSCEFNHEFSAWWVGWLCKSFLSPFWWKAQKPLVFSCDVVCTIEVSILHCNERMCAD